MQVWTITNNGGEYLAATESHGNAVAIATEIDAEFGDGYAVVRQINTDDLSDAEQTEVDNHLAISRELSR